MATKPRLKKSAATLQHPIRVVPLHRPELQRVAPAVAPRLTYRGGPLLNAVEVFTVFWGAEWKQAPQSALVTNLNLFFDYILTSALMDQLGEYSVPGKNIGHGKRTGTAVLTSPVPNTSVQDSEIQQLLQQEIASKNLPAPFLPGVLRLSRRHQRQHFLCGHALSRMFRVHRRPYRRRRAHFHHLARTLRSSHRSGARPGMVRRQQRRDRGHLRVENTRPRRLHDSTGMVE